MQASTNIRLLKRIASFVGRWVAGRTAILASATLAFRRLIKELRMASSSIDPRIRLSIELALTGTNESKTLLEKKEDRSCPWHDRR